VAPFSVGAAFERQAPGIFPLMSEGPLVFLPNEAPESLGNLREAGGDQEENSTRN